MSKARVVNRLSSFKFCHISLNYKPGKFWACEFLSFLLTFNNDLFGDV